MGWDINIEGVRATVRADVLAFELPRKRTITPESVIVTHPDPDAPAVETVVPATDQDAGPSDDTDAFEHARAQLVALIDMLPTEHNGVRVHAAGHLLAISVFEVEGKTLRL